MKRIWQVCWVEAVDGHKCIKENVVMYSELDQELLKDGGDVVRFGSFGNDASSRNLDHLEFIMGGDLHV